MSRRRVGALVAGAIAVACSRSDPSTGGTDPASPLASCGSSNPALFAGRLATNFQGVLLQVAGTDEVLGVTGRLDDLVQMNSNGRIADACFDVELEGTCAEHDERTFPVRYTLDVARVVDSRPVVPTNENPCLPSKRHGRR
jgi:hypothetical protein